MSLRDRGLLDAAGLSISDATQLFKRSRQALYQGLSHSRDYFSAKEAMVVLQDARRNDSSRIEEVIRYIDKNYPKAESEMILPRRVAHEQLAHVVRDADSVILVFNGNIDHLSPNAAFAELLVELIRGRRDVLDLVVPEEWVRGYIRRTLKLKLPNRIVEDDNVSYLPSFVMTSREGAIRAFVFGHLSTEELPPTDAHRLWAHFAPKFEESAEHIAREAV